MTEVVATVGARITVRGPREVLDRLRAALTRPNPKHEQLRRMRLNAANVPQLLTFYDECNDALVVPRGCVRLVRSCAHPLPVRWETTVTVVPQEPSPAPLRIDLRPYQREALLAMVREVQGVVEIAVGGGKTILAAAAVVTVQQPALVVVPTGDIADQWAEAFELVAGRVPRRLGGGHRRDLRALAAGEVCVAVEESLAAPDADALLRSAGALVIDEAHHVAAPSLLAIVHRCPARYRWFMTATPDRADGLGFVLELEAGPTVYRKTLRELVALGHLHEPTVYGVETGLEADPVAHRRWRGACGTCGWTRKVKPAEVRGVRAGTLKLGCVRRDRMTSRLCCPGYVTADGLRGTRVMGKALADMMILPEAQALLVALALWGVEDDRRTLILTPSRASAQACWDRLVDERVPAGVAYSGRADRKRRVDDFRAGRSRVLVATDLAKEGLNVPAIDLLVNATGGKAMGPVVQITGRAMRPEGKAPIVVDLVHAGEAFWDHWAERRTTYQREVGVVPTEVGAGQVFELLNARRAAG